MNEGKGKPFGKSVDIWISSCNKNPNLVNTTAAHDVAKKIQSSGKQRSSLQAYVANNGGMEALYRMMDWTTDPDSSETLVAKTFFLVNQMATRSNAEMRLSFVQHGIISKGIFHLMNPTSKSNYALILSTLSTISAGLYDRIYADVNAQYMKAIDLFLQYVGVYSSASRLIGNLAYHSQNQEPMIQAGVLDYVKKNLDAENKSARIASIFTLALLVGSEDEIDNKNRELEMPLDCIEIILQGLQCALDGKGMAGTLYRPAKVLLVLAKLCANDSNKSKIIEKGGVKLLARSININDRDQANQKILESALQCLWLLAYDDVGPKAIQDSCLDRIKQLERSSNKWIAINAQGCGMIINKLDKGKDGEDGVELVNLEEGEEKEEGSEDDNDDLDGYLESPPSQAQSSPQVPLPQAPPLPPPPKQSKGLKKKKKKQSIRPTLERKRLKVMISYQWDSQDIVKRIVHALREQKIDVWIDIEQMKGNIIDCMSKAVETSDIVCLCPSQRYAESPNCRLEAEYATTCQKTIVPLMMQRGYRPRGWLGLILGQRLWYPFYETDEADFQDTIERVVSAIHGGEDGQRGELNEEIQSFTGTSPHGIDYTKLSMHERLKETWKQEIKEELKDELKAELKTELREEILKDDEILKQLRRLL